MQSDFNSTTPPSHIQSFSALIHSIERAETATELQKRFQSDPLSANFNSFKAAVFFFVLHTVEGYISKTEIKVKDIEAIYICAHEEAYGDMSTAETQKMDLKAMRHPEYTHPPAQAEFNDFLKRYPELEVHKNDIKENLFGFLNSMTNLAYGKPENRVAKTPRTDGQIKAVYMVENGDHYTKAVHYETAKGESIIYSADPLPSDAIAFEMKPS